MYVSVKFFKEFNDGCFVGDNILFCQFVKLFYIMFGGNKSSRCTSRCVCRALSLAQNSALLWHDLACCYLMQMQRNSTINKSDVVAKCLAAAKQAVKLCPQSWQHWNILGVICISQHVKNYALAQHCFITAIDRESNNAIAWSNLGTLYLHLGTRRNS